MKLNKSKIARLTDNQAQSIHGGAGTNGSTNNKFTCCWCSQGEQSYECETVNPNDPVCNNDPRYK